MASKLWKNSQPPASQQPPPRQRPPQLTPPSRPKAVSKTGWRRCQRPLGTRSIAAVTTLGDKQKLGQATVRDFREDLLLDTLEVLQMKDPAELGPQVARRSFRRIRPSLRLSHHFLQAVRGALRQGLNEEAADVIRQLVQREGVDGNESLLRAATQEATLQAMQSWQEQSYWDLALGLLEYLRRHPRSAADPAKVQLAAARASQEKWGTALTILEDLRHLGFETTPERAEVLMETAAVGGWNLAFAALTAGRLRANGSVDRQGEVAIETFGKRTDRALGWILATEMLSEVQRQSTQPASSSEFAACKSHAEALRWASALAFLPEQEPGQGVGVLRTVRAIRPDPVDFRTGWVPRANAVARARWLPDLQSRGLVVQATSRLQLWARSLALLDELPKPSSRKVVSEEEAALIFPYRQAIFACSRSTQTAAAVQVLRDAFRGAGRESSLLVGALLSHMAAELPTGQSLREQCDQVSALIRQQEEVGLRPLLATQEAALHVFERGLASQAARKVLADLRGDLYRSLLARPGQDALAEAQKAMEQLEDHDVMDDVCETAFHRLCRWRGDLPSRWPQHRGVPTSTSRSELQTLGFLATKVSWSPLGRESLRRELHFSRVDCRPGVARGNFHGYARVQFEIFLPLPHIDELRGSGGRSPLPLLRPALGGRRLHCRGRSIGSSGGVVVPQQDLQSYGFPVAVRNALLQIIATVQRPFFGRLRALSSSTFGFVDTPELKPFLTNDVFFARRHLPHDAWNPGQPVSFSLDFTRSSPRAVNIEFEDQIPPLE